MLIVMTTMSFKRHYIFLALLILAGLTVALLTLAGLDPRIGWIAAGFTIGAQVAVHMLRSAEVRFARITEDFNREISEGRLVRPSESALSGAVSIKASITGEPESLSPELAQFSPAGTVVALDSFATNEGASAPGPIETTPQLSSPRCVCACGCELGSDGGFEGMCDTCRHSRLQESLACECDYTRSSSCTCGVVKHWPMSVDADLVAAG